MLVIENVGNLVCPALFDLGEAARVVLSSVTEGADKPIKYPQMFREADLVLLTKVDLLPYVDFDTERHARDLKLISPRAADAARLGHRGRRPARPGTTGSPGARGSGPPHRTHHLPRDAMSFQQAHDLLLLGPRLGRAAAATASSPGRELHRG